MASRPTANTFNNDVSLLWLLKNSKTVYRSILAQAQTDTSGTGLSTVPNAEAQYNDLITLINQTAEEIDAYIDQIELNLRTDLVTKSEYGTAKSAIESTISIQASSIAETHTIATRAENNQIAYESFMQGQICRGYVTNPDYTANVPGAPQYLYGIVISSQTSITTTTKDDFGDSNKYYEIDLSSKPTFGFYTSEGWQFWIGGDRVGWYNSKDGRLHVANLEAENAIKMGNWQLLDANGFGIKYIGG